MNSVRKSLAFSLAEKYSILAIQFGSSLVLARLLTPKDLGIFSVCLGISAFAQIVRDFGATNYIIQEKILTEDRIRAALTVTTLSAWLMAIVMVAMAGPIASFYDEPGVRKALYVLAGTFVLVPLGSTILAVLRREMQFGKLFIINVMSACSHAFVGIGLGVMGFGYMSLAWASVAGIATTASAAVFFHGSRAHFVPGVRDVKRVLDFGMIVSAANMLQQVHSSAPSLITGRLLGFAPVGLIERATGVSNIFSRAILQGVQPVILPAFSAKNRAGQGLAESCLMGMNYIAVLSWPFAFYLVLVAEPLVLFLFGKQWIESAPLLRILAVVLLFICVRPVCEPAMIAVGRVDLKLKVAAYTLPATLCFTVVGALHGTLALAWGLTFAQIAQALLTLQLTRGIVGFPTKSMVSIIAKLGIITGAAVGAGGVAEWICELADIPMLLNLMFTAVSMGSGWLAGVAVTQHPILKEIKIVYAKIKIKLPLGFQQ